MSFAHEGLRPLWPVTFFLPLFLVGSALLLQAMRPRTAGMHLHFRGRRLLAIGLCVLACLAAARVVLADPAPSGPRACATASRQDANALAETFYQKGDYQHAGECYEAAGDKGHADLAFVKAAGPKAEEAGRSLKSQADTAKVLFASVGKAFRGH